MTGTDRPPRQRRIYRITDDPAEILRNAGPTISVPEAGVCCHMGEAKARRKAAAGEHPFTADAVPVLRSGNRLRVRTADVRRYLGLPAEHTEHTDASAVAS